jgi:hypothetical protein
VGDPQSCILNERLGAGNFDRLILWDTQDPENHDINTLSLKTSSSGVLDLIWRRDRNCLQLIVLSTCGEHLVFPANFNLTENEFRLKDFADDLTVMVHSSLDFFKHGNITCCKSIIASAVGSEVVLRGMESGALPCRYYSIC